MITAIYITSLLIVALAMHGILGAFKAMDQHHKRYSKLPLPERMVVEDFAYQPMRIQKRISLYEQSHIHSDPVGFEKFLKKQMLQELSIGLLDQGFIEVRRIDDPIRYDERLFDMTIWVAPPPSRRKD